MDKKEAISVLLIDVVSAMNAAFSEYRDGKYKDAKKKALRAVEDAVQAYQCFINDYPYTEKDFDYARALAGMIEHELHK